MLSISQHLSQVQPLSTKIHTKQPWHQRHQWEWRLVTVTVPVAELCRWEPQRRFTHLGLWTWSDSHDQNQTIVISKHVLTLLTLLGKFLKLLVDFFSGSDCWFLSEMHRRRQRTRNSQANAKLSDRYTIRYEFSRITHETVDCCVFFLGHCLAKILKLGWHHNMSPLAHQLLAYWQWGLHLGRSDWGLVLEQSSKRGMCKSFFFGWSTFETFDFWFIDRGSTNEFNSDFTCFAGLQSVLCLLWHCHTRSHDDTLAARGMFTSMCLFLRFRIYFHVSVETQEMSTSYNLLSQSKNIIRLSKNINPKKKYKKQKKTYNL